MANHTHCSECGNPYANSDWPKKCNHCGHMMWKNPIPVATILQPMTDGERFGLLILERAIQPKLGEWSLPGGFMEDNGESSEEAAARELFEETGIKLDILPKLVFTQSTNNGQLLIMHESKQLFNINEITIKLCSENSAWRVAWELENLAFPIHNRAANYWFKKNSPYSRFISTAQDISGLSIEGTGTGSPLLMNRKKSIKPTDKDQDPGENFKIFLAGSIDQGKAVDWQTQVTGLLKNAPITVFNPRRDDWDSTWEQDIENDEFRGQVEWELKHMDMADKILMFFDPKGKAPISLLELGLHARDGKLIVCCPDGFWRKGNVQIVCNAYQIPLYDTIEDFIKAIKSVVE